MTANNATPSAPVAQEMRAEIQHLHAINAELLESLLETTAWLAAILNATYDTSGKKAARELSERIGAAAKAAGVTMIGTAAVAKARIALAKAKGEQP